MNEVVIACGALCISWWVAEVVRRNAGALRLVQNPNDRSSHAVPTPSGGGIGIAIAGCAAGLFYCHSTYLWLALLISAATACIGLADDRFDLSSKIRIVFHVIVVGTMLLAGSELPAIVTPFGSLSGIVLCSIVLLAGVWWINLFNFMDGIDGLAAGEAVCLCIGLALLISLSGAGETPTVPWLIALAAASAGFLMLNWPPAKVFMGDAGSNYLATIFLALALFELSAGRVNYAAVSILVACFVTDATITLVTRVFAGERFFAAHRLHAYQKLSRRWNGHRKVTVLYLVINLIWLYPLAYVATAFPQYGWAAIVAAYVPIAIMCVRAGAGVPEIATADAE
ncbi:MraY family glycosyltransferase [Paradevosia shaoguanensis]|uniref:MraY family glycosyltransferase n=1 Tax=Paradevosia shaoguanensis TaxID=1335043 RepID=UPI003C720B46